MRQGGIYQSEKVQEVNSLLEAAEDPLKAKYPALLEVFAADMSTLMEKQDKPLLFIEAEPYTARSELDLIASDIKKLIGRKLEPFSYKPYDPEKAPDPEKEEIRNIAVFSICK